MKELMPQEIEVWYLIPALRKELARIFIDDYKLIQKETAEMLNLTEPAISQYMKSKRANEVKFSKKDLEKIKKTAKNIIEKKESMLKALYNLTVEFRGKKIVCDIHRSKDKTISKKCNICS